MTERVSGETVIAGGKIAAFQRRSGEGGLPKIGVGIKEANKAFDLNVVEFAGEVRNGIVPTNQPVGDDVEAGFHLFGDDVPGYVVLHIEEIGGGAITSIERGNRSAQDLQLGRVTDARVAARAGKVETGSGAHWRPLARADSRAWLGLLQAKAARLPFVPLDKKAAATKARKARR